MSIMVDFYICLNSRKLYEELVKYNLNVTDFGSGRVLVYGDGLSAAQIAAVIAICDRYGRYSEIHISGGKGDGMNGEEEKEKA